jgi:hypothetical protein
VRQTNSGYECAQCGAPIAIPKDALPRTSFSHGSGKPRVRILSVDGNEVHRCVVPGGRAIEAAVQPVLALPKTDVYAEIQRERAAQDRQ